VSRVLAIFQAESRSPTRAGATRRAVDYKTYFAFLAPTRLAQLRRMRTTDENACNNAAQGVRASLRINLSLTPASTRVSASLTAARHPRESPVSFRRSATTPVRAAVNADALCARTTATAACGGVGGGDAHASPAWSRGNPSRYYAVS